MTTELKPDYLPPGTVVRGYTILDRVGAGGFGALYKVTADDRVYALKLSTTRFSDFTPEEQRRQEERADREVVALKSLNHPNIVRAHEFGRWPDIETGYPYILMDFVDGYRLYDWRDQTTPSLRAICIVVLKIARALHEMHRVHIVHRDLKSENVLVRGDGEPVIVDFGISKPKSSYTMTAARSMLGTYTHFTPEYCAWVLAPNKGKTDKFPFGPAQDLHCVGYMLYELLTGAAPFRKSDPLEDSHDGTAVPLSLLESIRDHLPPPPSTLNERIPGRVDDICMSLLAKAPEQRPQTGEELAVALERALELADESWDQPFDVPARALRARAPSAATRPNRAHDAPRNGISISIAQAPSSSLPAGVVVGGAAAVPALSAEVSPSVLTPPARPRSISARASQPTPAPAPAGGFSPPTGEQSAGFIPPDAPAPAPQVRSDVHGTLPSAVRKLQPRLHASSATAQRRKLLPLALGGALVVLIGAYLALLQRSAATSEEEQKPRSLLTETQQAADAPAPSPAPHLPPVPTPPLAAPAETAEPSVATEDAPAGEIAKRPTARRPAAMNSDEQAIDQLLAEQYGRPRVPAGADVAPEPSPAPKGPAWLKTTQAPAAAPKETAALGIPLGAHIRVRLRSNLDSRTIANGPVQAMLTRPFIHAGKVLLPSRTMLYGRSTSQGGRFLITFGTIRLPDNREVLFQGLAMDLDDGKPGLQAGRRIAGSAPQQDSVAKQVLKDTANTVLATVGGDTPQEIARNAGGRVVNQSGTASGPSPMGDTLLLDAGVDFDIFVEAAF